MSGVEGSSARHLFVSGCSCVIRHHRGGGTSFLRGLGLPATIELRLAGVAAVLAAATVLLAVVAGVIGLAAYAAATQRPNLAVEIQFRFSRPNAPVLEVQPPDQFGARFLAPWRQCEAQVLVHNKSSYSARNPAVRIDLRGLGGGLGDPQAGPQFTSLTPSARPVPSGKGEPITRFTATGRASYRCSTSQVLPRIAMRARSS